MYSESELYQGKIMYKIIYKHVVKTCTVPIDIFFFNNACCIVLEVRIFKSIINNGFIRLLF